MKGETGDLRLYVCTNCGKKFLMSDDEKPVCDECGISLTQQGTLKVKKS